jgi:hypothetical protein
MPDNELAILDDQRRALELTRGERFITPIAQSAKFGDGPSRHHRPFFDDYDVAKACIEQALGDLTDIDIFGRDVLVAVFCRPNVTPGGIYIGTKEVKEDWWQHKVVLVLKCGPEAFVGDDTYVAARFGAVAPPRQGDWLFARPEAGMQINLMGEGGSRPQGKDHRGNPMDIFEWDGWPCRIIPDDEFKGRLPKPHAIV